MPTHPKYLSDPTETEIGKANLKVFIRSAKTGDRPTKSYLIRRSCRPSLSKTRGPTQPLVYPQPRRFCVIGEDVKKGVNRTSLLVFHVCTTKCRVTLLGP